VRKNAIAVSTGKNRGNAIRQRYRNSFEATTIKISVEERNGET
jgi:hypothetical protein